MPPAGAPTSLRRSWLLAALTERLPTKFVAVLLALVLWVVVRGEETTEIVMGARFLPVLDPSIELTGRVPDSVEIVVTGRRREVLKLQANAPVVRRRFDEDTPRRLRVTLQPADVEFPIGVEARAREVRPSAITLNFRPRSTGGDRTP